MEIIRHRKFDEWLRKLRDRNALNRIALAVQKFENYGEVAGDTKALGQGIYEVRFHFGSGYRVYYTYKHGKIILLLIGGDKSTQHKDIEKAKHISDSWKG